jgi:hypothetical protein
VPVRVVRPVLAREVHAGDDAQAVALVEKSPVRRVDARVDDGDAYPCAVEPRRVRARRRRTHGVRARRQRDVAERAQLLVDGDVADVAAEREARGRARREVDDAKG